MVVGLHHGYELERARPSAAFIPPARLHRVKVHEAFKWAREGCRFILSETTVETDREERNGESNVLITHFSTRYIDIAGSSHVPVPINRGCDC